MNILLINTYDKKGGAAIASLRLAKALRKQNINVNMIVQKKATNFNYIETTNNNLFNKTKNFIYFALERFIFSFYEKDSSIRFAFSIANTGEDISKHPLVQKADIIHLNWINFGFLSLKSLEKIFELNKPIVWTQHDMWAFTGGCHHAYECDNYQKNCGNCSLYLKKSTFNDLSHKVLERKNKIFSKYNLNIISVSNWLANRAKKSTLFASKKHFVISNPLDPNFNAMNKIEAKKHLGINEEKIILLFGSEKVENPIKGFNYFVQALNILKNDKNINTDNFLIVLFGNIKTSSEKLTNQLPFQHKYLGFIDNITELSQVYSAASITVVPSLYETFGQVIAESMICKTPAVAFNNSGPLDVIKHKENGYLAKFKSAQDLADGIKWILFEADYEKTSNKAHNYVNNNFSDTVIAQKYIDLYKSILSKQ